LNPEAIYFPEAEIIRPFAMAFMRMMFAHANFETEVDLLQRAIANDPQFAERWDARSRPKRMANLIERHLGPVPELETIRQILTDSIDPCDQRNLLAHGRWWRFDPKTAKITVRAQRKGRPEFADYTETEILRIAGELKGPRGRTIQTPSESRERYKPMCHG
jgi:hypothetical protein